jgi:trigger factor
LIAPVKTSVERVDDTTVKLSVTVEPERVAEAIDAAARKLAGEVKVPGFRPGRVPRKVLESRLGKGAITQEAVQQALPQLYQEAAQSEELPVVGPPDFDLDTFEEGQEGQFTVTVEVRPDIEVPDYRSLRIAHPEWEVTDEDVTAQLDVLRERFASLETVKRPAQVGDHVVISISGTRDGEPVEEVAADDALYKIDDPEESEAALDRSLVGAESGSIVKFTDTLGPDYGELAGAQLDFSAIVKEVKAQKLPDLDDQFAQDASEFESLDELTSELRAHLAKDKLSGAMQALRGRVVEALAEQVDITLPESMVQSELRFRLDRIAQTAEQHDMSFEQYLAAAGTNAEEVLSRFEQEARQTVEAQLIVDAVGREAGIDVDQEDLTVEVMGQAQRLGRDPSEIAKLMTHPDRIGALVADTFRRKTIDYLLEEVEVLSAPTDEDMTAVFGDETSGDDPAAPPVEDGGDDPAAPTAEE